jgi:precorrin-2 methylase
MSTRSSKPGQLTIVGSGIASVSQLTLQAIAVIEKADVVCFVLSDPATEAFIRTKNANCIDLFQFYDDGKYRMDTYIQMTEVSRQ